MIKPILLSISLIVLSTFFTSDIGSQELDDEGRQLIEVPYTYTPPQIDGDLSEGEWDNAASNTVDFVNLGVAGNSGPGESDGPEDISYTFYVCYDDEFLYVGVSVLDDAYISSNYGQRLQWDLPVTWENDAVEYFFDGDLSRTLDSCRNPTETETGGQWIYGIDAEDSPLPFVSPELYGEKDRPYGTGRDAVWYAKTSVNLDTNDWSQEARFALDIIGSPASGDDIGFNINVDDVDIYNEATLEPEFYEELREIQLYWTVYIYEAGEITTENTHEIEDLWGTMRFLEPVKVKQWDLY